MDRYKLMAHVILTRIIGFFIFLILLGLANLLNHYYVQNTVFNLIVGFLNNNLWLIILFGIIFLIGEMFGYLIFPLNIPAPLFNAVGSLFLIQFIFKLLIFVFSIVGVNTNLPFGLIQVGVIILVFILILVIGYIQIILDATSPKKKKIQRKMTD